MPRGLARAAVLLTGVWALTWMAQAAGPPTTPPTAPAKPRAAAEPNDPAGGKIRLLILSGANNHNWKATTPVLKKLYEDSGRFTVDVTENVPALKGEDFAKYDAIVSNYTTYPNIEGHRWPAETEKAFLAYVAAGHGFVLFHAASTAWNDWPEFTDLIGLSWEKPKSGHGASHSFAVTITDKEHPVTKDMKDFQHVKDELYHRQVKHATAKVLAAAYSDKATKGTGENEPMIVVTEHGKGRVFHNVMGHDPAAMGGVGWRTLMLRGTEWAATGKATIPIPTDWPAPGKSQEAGKTADSEGKATSSARTSTSRTGPPERASN